MKNSLPPEVIKKANEIADQMIEKQLVAYEKGVPIAIGTDAPVSGEHTHTAKEMHLLVQNMGMSNIQVLQSATIVSARAIQRDTTLGSLDVGKTADVIVVNKEILNDITLLQHNPNIDYVFKDGTLMSKRGIIEINKN
jgi:imidazolonepropionase-like amidohydrolase